MRVKRYRQDYRFYTRCIQCKQTGPVRAIYLGDAFPDHPYYMYKCMGCDEK